MEIAAIISLIATGVKILSELIQVGKSVTPQAVALVNAIKALVEGDVSDEAISSLRAAILAVNDEIALMEDELLDGDGVGDAV